VVDFDGAGPFVGDHLAADLIHNAFIDKAGQVVDCFQVSGIDGITGFVDTPDLDIKGQMAPLQNISVEHSYWILPKIETL
jgi:hypothetical protein